MYKKMLVTLDGSELAEVVLDYAKELAGGLALDTILLHIYSHTEHEYITMRRGYIDRVAEMLERQVREIQEKIGQNQSGNHLRFEPNL